MNNIIIIGGDKRQKVLCSILSGQGYSCRHIASDEELMKEGCIGKGDAVILPIPVTKDKENIYSSDSGVKIKIADVMSATDSSNLVFGGGIPKTLTAYLEEKEVAYLDYLDCTEAALYNAYLTGIGAVKLLYERTEGDVSGKKALVTGYGRVARFTARMLSKAGCDVYVGARDKLQLAEAECTGYKAIELNKLSSFIYLFDYIFNTVPENIFTFDDVHHMKGLYFELASAPFGVRSEYFKGREKTYVCGGALPGRYLPHSAAEKLAEITIKHINLRNGGD